MSNPPETALTPRPGKAWSGFTLIELLVATTLLMILATILLTVVTNTTTIASKTAEQIDATRVARESFDLIGRDLMLAMVPRERNNTNSLQFLVNPAVSATYANRDAMFWQAPLVRNPTNGNLSIVGYFVLHDQQTDKKKSRFQLRRVYIEPSSQNGDYNLYNTNTPWLSASILGSFAPGSSDADSENALKGWVADGVIGMWIRCLSKTGAVITNAPNMGFDSRIGFQITGKQWYPTNYSALPSFVEVTLVCVSPREMSRLQSLGTLPTTTSATNFPSMVAGYADQLRTNNPGVKGVTAFTRKFRMLNSD